MQQQAAQLAQQVGQASKPALQAGTAVAPVVARYAIVPLINAVIDPAAGSESGRIGNLNPKSVVRKK